MSEQTMDDLTQRLVRLERQNRRLKWWVVVSVVVSGAALLTDPIGPRLARRTIEAEMFVLRDGGGIARAALALVEGGPVASLFDKDERIRAVLGLVEGEPLLGFTDGRERRVQLGLLEGEPFLSLLDQDGKIRAILALEGGEPALGLCDKDGKLIFSAP